MDGSSKIVHNKVSKFFCTPNFKPQVATVKAVNTNQTVQPDKNSVFLLFLTDFRPVSDIIRNELTYEQRERLLEHIVNSVREVEAIDLVALLPLLAGNIMLQKAILNTVVTFITNEMKLQIVD